ncbi:hypothetical protein [Nakamurella lactea]|uniref:hypothetical protein n=1 Tax=Nakamurella lactea TaxID=459515 RepID=UPI0004095103|nr:hypothetical protein [Nakamurella lactea]
MFYTARIRDAARRALFIAGALLGITAAAACSSTGSGAAAPVPSTVTVVRTEPTTVAQVSTVTDVSTETRVQPTTATVTATATLTPKPAGTRTEVRTSKVTVSVTEKHTVTAAPPEPAGTFGDGTYVVGKDVAPGTYQASDPNPPDGLCYWETRSADGELADNGVNDGLLFIRSGAFSVRVSGCGTWKPVSGQ